MSHPPSPPSLRLLQGDRSITQKCMALAIHLTGPGVHHHHHFPPAQHYHHIQVILLVPQEEELRSSLPSLTDWLFVHHHHRLFDVGLWLQVSLWYARSCMLTVRALGGWTPLLFVIKDRCSAISLNFTLVPIIRYLSKRSTLISTAEEQKLDARWRVLFFACYATAIESRHENDLRSFVVSITDLWWKSTNLNFINPLVSITNGAFAKLMCMRSTTIHDAT